MNSTGHNQPAEAKRLAGGAADAAEPVHQRLDELCTQLWGVDERGLRAIQSAYRDLYVPAPKDATDLTTAAIKPAEESE